MTTHSKTQATIRPAGRADTEAMACIYNYFVAQTVITFEQTLVTNEQFAQRVENVQAASLPWLVAEVQDESGDAIAGFAYASMWKGRCAYRYSVEVTVYLDPAHTGRGIGSRLYSQLLADLKSRQFHTAIGGIALPNKASVALHEKFGFEKVAQFKEVGFKSEKWIDVGYWQLIL